MDANTVCIELSHSQALVLFDFLARFNQQEQTDFEDQAEALVLFHIESILEKQLAEPFLKNYSAILDQARQTVRETY